MKRVCIVGCGAIAPVHTEAVKKTNNAELYAVCDIDKSRADNMAMHYGVKAVYDFEEVVADNNINSLHICTPHYLHFEMIERALRAGKDVICEKPVVMTKDEYHKLLKLPDADRVCVVMQNRLNPSVKKFREIAESGELGKVLAVKGVLTWQRDSAYYKNGSWRGKMATEGGGVLINQAVHTLDFFSYIVGNIESVKAQMTNFSLPEIEVEDTISACFKIQENVRGIFFATNAYGTNTSPEFEVTFEKGTLCYKDAKLFKNGVLIAEDFLAKTEKFYWGQSHELLIKDYYDNNEFFSPFDVKNTMQALFAIYESAKNNGEEVRI